MAKIIDIIQACKLNDRKAQHHLYKHCYPTLMKVCYRYTNNKEDAAVLYNNGFLKILNGLQSYDVDVPFEHWSRRVMINSILDEFRKNKKYKENIVFKDWQGDDAHEVYIDSKKTDAKFDVEGILKLLHTLAPATCRIFNLYAMDGYSHKEISKMLDISEGTSKWHLSEARRILKEKIESGVISILFWL